MHRKAQSLQELAWKGQKGRSTCSGCLRQRANERDTFVLRTKVSKKGGTAGVKARPKIWDELFIIFKYLGG